LIMWLLFVFMVRWPPEAIYGRRLPAGAAFRRKAPQSR
jgi:hypothetical protein